MVSALIFIFRDEKVPISNPAVKESVIQEKFEKAKKNLYLADEKIIDTRENSEKHPDESAKSMPAIILGEEKNGVFNRFEFSNTPKPNIRVVDSSEEEKDEESLHSEVSGKRHSARLQDKNINYDLMFDEITDSKFLKDSFNTDVKGRKCPDTRWGRSEDKSLFKLIRDMEEQGALSLKEILQVNSRSDVYKHEGLCSLAHAFQWKSLIKNLLFRIKNLCGREFSVRELKMLKKLLKKKYKYEKIDYNDLIYEFPGKSVNQLMEVTKRIIREKNNKTLSQLHICQFKVPKIEKKMDPESQSQQI
jgi:hypothetical protein